MSLWPKVNALLDRLPVPLLVTLVFHGVVLYAMARWTISPPGPPPNARFEKVVDAWQHELDSAEPAPPPEEASELPDTPAPSSLTDSPPAPDITSPALEAGGQGGADLLVSPLPSSLPAFILPPLATQGPGLGTGQGAGVGKGKNPIARSGSPTASPPPLPHNASPGKPISPDWFYVGDSQPDLQPVLVPLSPDTVFFYTDYTERSSTLPLREFLDLDALRRSQAKVVYKKDYYLDWRTFDYKRDLPVNWGYAGDLMKLLRSGAKTIVFYETFRIEYPQWHPQTLRNLYAAWEEAGRQGVRLIVVATGYKPYPFLENRLRQNHHLVVYAHPKVEKIGLFGFMFPFDDSDPAVVERLLATTDRWWLTRNEPIVSVKNYKTLPDFLKEVGFLP